jgi:hypothetical protein
MGMNIPALVESLGHLVKIDDGSHIFPEFLHQSDVDVGLEQGRTHLLEHAIEHLLIDDRGLGQGMQGRINLAT